MSVIIISSDDLTKGQHIAEKTAQDLGYRCLGREILATVAKEHDIPEETVIKTLDDAPTFLGMSSKTRNRYLACIQDTVLPLLVKDNVVCHGLMAQLYVLAVSHVLKVRILSDQEALARQLAAQSHISPEKAAKILGRKIKQRQQWSLDAFSADVTDPSGYDLVIKLSQIDADRAVEIIKDTIADRRFQPMTYSIKRIMNVALAIRIKALLIERFPDAKVEAVDGRVMVQTLALKRDKVKKASAIKELVGQVKGVTYVEVRIVNDFFRQAIESFR
ncbi:MAG: cytidylate kinase family protein [Deltaproteobacteria bacterium]|nr:cytidylate kinase family protein [Deltaproteobacteria bacterium]